ncbi:MAG: hypothetical protein EBQ71_17045 [Betaproteobacteria bacterium]|nr:hypothetical protein [Betaproteobacteria bacterium]
MWRQPDRCGGGRGPLSRQPGAGVVRSRICQALRGAHSRQSSAPCHRRRLLPPGREYRSRSPGIWR